MDWYRSRIGEPTTDDEVRGYWVFVAGLVLAVVGILLFLASTAVEPQSGTYFALRRVGYVLAALGLSLLVVGFVVRLPLLRSATYAGYAGVVLCVLAIAWFLAIYPSGWGVRGGGTGAAVIELYTLGVTVATVGGAFVPLLLGGADLEERAELAEAEAAAASERASGAEREAAAADRAGAAEDRAAALSVELAEINDSQARFEVYEDAAGGWRWRLRHRNGDVVADSGQGYGERTAAGRAVDGVKRNAPGAGESRA